ncbi:glycosyltransferase [Mucilaginibacter sp. PAMB04168]|uniref:glycosyltransferase n=1 Tax=Mucilaginibacter sp. PAMB04168 TaxID=3138567 RepID=UPI0031F6F101
MGRKVVFTIAAKNYLGQAKALGYSIKETNPEVDFHILLADEIDGHDLQASDFTLVEAKTLGIKKFHEMAFKYNVVEYSTSIKPFYLDHLFKNYEYDKILYLDPDMVVYDNLDYLYEQLDTYDAILTPHIIKPYVEYEGATSEEELLFVGIYNLGFFGVRRGEVGNTIIQWWKAKLTDQCFADKADALHVDQRWMDFLPSLYGSNVGILRHPGVNTAFWNMHEREFTDVDGKYFVDGQPLLVYHFSGLVPEEYHKLCRKQTKYSLDNKPEYTRLFKEYVDLMNEKCGLQAHKDMHYTYSSYKNGVYIVPYQRRLYRGILNQKSHNFANPFEIGKNSFYELLDNNKLLIIDDNAKYAKLQKSFPNYKAMFEKANKGLKVLKKLIGIKRYYMIMRYLGVQSRFEEQMFLFEKNG